MIGTIDIKARPIKFAYLVEPNKPTQIKEAIQLSTTLWGGDFSPIIPLYKSTPASWREKHMGAPSAKSIVLGYIDSFDPDILVQISEKIPPHVKDLGIEVIQPGDIWKNLDEDRRLSPQFGLGMFELLKDIYDKNYKFKAKYPLKIIFPKIPSQLSLFWTSLFGQIHPSILPLLKKYYFEPLEIKTPNFKIENLRDYFAGNVLFPRRITHHEIQNYGNSRRRGASIYFMDASKTEDIVDFWNLRALGSTVLPMPKQFTKNPVLKKIVINFLKSNRIPWRHNPEVCDTASFIRARNCTMEEMQEYASSLKIKKEPNDPSNDGYFSLQHWYPRIWDEWARNKDGAIPDNITTDAEETIDITDTQEARIRIPSVLPKFAEKYVYHGEPRCANEVSFRFYGANEYVAEAFPKSRGENFIRSISGITARRGDWRVSNRGLVRLVQDDYHHTHEIPFSEKVFFAWLEDLEWKPKLSPPGLLAKQIYKKLDGYIHLLKNEKVLGLLEHMNGGSVTQQGDPVDKNKVNQARNLPVGEVKNRLGGTTKEGLHSYLVKLGIFKIGLKVQCQHCTRGTWYPLDKVSDVFNCPLCQNTFNAVGNLDSATWSYRTTGPFSIPSYADGAYAVLLTLGFFDEHWLTTMRITPTTSFSAQSPTGETLEADFAAFWQESLYGEQKNGLLFGECKTYGKFEKNDFDRMYFFAKKFPGAILIFSTLRKHLTETEITEITKIAKTGRKYWKAERPINPVLILTGTELLSEFRPPNCWEEELKNKHDRYCSGLLSICDITQQIYLGLPSWHDTWREKWEKDRIKRNKKNKQTI